MTTKTNALIRVCEVLEKAARVESNDPAIDVWRKVFEIPRDGVWPDHEVARAVFTMAEEFDRGVLLLEQQGVPADRYAGPVKQVRKALSARNLGSSWNPSVRHVFSGEPLAALSLVSWALEDEGVGMSPDELEEIRKELSALELKAARINGNPDLRRFLRRELRRIKQALIDYPILGVEAFNRAAADALATRPEDAEVIAANAATDEITALDKLLNRINKAGEGLEKWTRAASMIFSGTVITLFSLYALDMLPEGAGKMVKALQAAQQMKALGPGTPPVETAPPEDPLSE